ncbi:MAG: hypothetical protein K8T90_01705 [Planctomycetes bacterium]|nr:hypothetical protein [Planctomycetota bacterium]
MDHAADGFDARRIALEGMAGTLTGAEAAAAVAAIDYLADVLGRDTLEAALKIQHRGLSLLFINKVPWTRRALIDLADDLHATISADGRAELLRRLRHSELHSEARSVLHIAARYAKRGAAIRIEPAVQVKPGRDPKRPDLHVRAERIPVAGYVEITALHRSFAEKRSSETSLGLLLPTFAPPDVQVLHAGRIYQPLGPDRIAEFRDRLANAARRAAESGGVVVVSEEGVIDMAVAPPQARAQIDAWAAKYGLHPQSVDGPPDDHSDPDRICRALRSKVEQLPTTEPAVVVVGCSYISLCDVAMANATMVAVREELYRQPQLAAVVLAAGVMPAHDEAKCRIGEAQLVKVSNLDSTDVFLVIPNKYARPSGSRELHRLTVEAFDGLTELP